MENFSPFPLSVPGLNQSKREDEAQWGMWACNQLTLDGSDVLGKFSLLQVFLLSFTSLVYV